MQTDWSDERNYELTSLREELASVVNLDRICRLVSFLDITPNCARVLYRLWVAKGRFLHRDYLVAASQRYAGVESDCPRSVDVVICKLRKALGQDAIESTPRGRGAMGCYRLSTVGKHKVWEALTS